MRSRPNWTLVGLGALIIVALFTYPQWRVLIGKRSTTPGGLYSQANATQQSVLLDIRRTQGAPNADKAYQALLTSIPAPTSDLPTPDGAQMQAIASGDFVTLDGLHTATGHVTLYRLSDNSALLRFDNFTVSNGPDLKVYLCASVNPLTAADVQTGKLQFLVGALKGTIGAQNYPTIPADLDLSRYKSVVIFSDSLQAVYSSAPLG